MGVKDYLLELVGKSKTTAEGRLIAREYLQARVLDALQRNGAFEEWVFVGGTALRFLYRIPRFSEDLDFSRFGNAATGESLERTFLRYMDGIRKAFEAEVYKVQIRSRPKSVVQSAFVAFPELLYEVGLSPHRDQKISIKVEIDTNPPAGAGTERSIRRNHVLLHLFHFDKASLFSGKLHALIQRPYVKGRDVYDLMWYLSDPTWPEPNLQLLRSSLRQTGTDFSDSKIATWRTIVRERLSTMDWDRVVRDVAPFLERPEEINLLTRENILGLLES